MLLSTLEFDSKTRRRTGIAEEMFAIGILPTTQDKLCPITFRDYTPRAGPTHASINLGLIDIHCNQIMAAAR